jgi:hypothetical protein
MHYPGIAWLDKCIGFHRKIFGEISEKEKAPPADAFIAAGWDQL